MSFSSIVRKLCKGNCGSPPFIGLQGFCRTCRPDLVAAKIKATNAKQYQKGKVSKLVRVQMESGDHEGASRQNLINDIDWAFSRLVRQREADKFGNIHCYCCGKSVQWAMAQNMHFIPRQHFITRWDNKNCHAGCKTCNEILNGNLDAFAVHLDKDEANLPDRLKELSREPFKYSQDDLKQLLIDIRSKLKIIEQKWTKKN